MVSADRLPATLTLLRDRFMRALRLTLPLVLSLALLGCAETQKDVTMPDVTGRKLDIAYDKIANAGFDDKDKVKIEGGGSFGVVMEGNWTVCEQQPAAGEKIAKAPILTIDRFCDSDEPSDDATDLTPTATPTEELPAILTAKNNKDFAALLKSGECSKYVAKFAKKYEGQTAQFNGNISVMGPHGDMETRFDFLISVGDFDPDKGSGPTFVIRDKNVVFDMNVTGDNIPEYIGEGQNFRFTVELGEYNPDTCLYMITPVETKVR